MFKIIESKMHKAIGKKSLPRMKIAEIKNIIFFINPTQGQWEDSTAQTCHSVMSYK